jgi:pimeloyl-ACP methyl ester carboxylesterase
MNNILIDRSFARLAEGLIHYRSTGPEGSVPLVMLHASPASSKSLEPLAVALAAERRVILPDTPGNGLSCPPTDAQPSLTTYAAMLDQLCETLRHPQIDLYGTHTGAHIAIEWAIAYPGRVRRIILDGVAILAPEQRAEFLTLYAPPRAPDSAGTQFPWAWNLIRDQMIFWPHYRKDADHLRQGGQFEPRLLHDLTMDLLGALDTYHQPYEAVFRHDVLARLPLVMHRTLWLHGEHGPLDANAEAAFALLQAAEAVAVQGAPDKAATINAFLAEKEKQCG